MSAILTRAEALRAIADAAGNLAVAGQIVGRKRKEIVEALTRGIGRPVLPDVSRAAAQAALDALPEDGGAAVRALGIRAVARAIGAKSDTIGARVRRAQRREKRKST